MTLESRPAVWTYDPETGVTRVHLHGTTPSDATVILTVSSVIGFHLDADSNMIGFEFHADLGKVEDLARLPDEDDEL